MVALRRELRQATPVRFLACATTLVLLGTALGVARGVACAQPRWLVVDSADDAGSADSLRAVEQALRMEGADVLPSGEAAARWAESRSDAVLPVPEALRRRLGVVTEHVLDLVARGEGEEALREGRRMLQILEPYLPALGRDPAARDVGDLCYYLVRAESAEGRGVQLDTCLRIAPGFEPSDQLHPPAVRDARRQRGSAGLAVLAVRVANGEGCRIRVQGRARGRAPGLRLRVPPGRYAIEVECASPGRVHRVEVRAGEPTRVDVDAAFDQALRTDGALRLAYGGAVPESTTERHLLKLAEALGVQRLLVRRPEGWMAYAVEGVALRRVAHPSLPGELRDPRRVAQAALERPGELRNPSSRVASRSGEAIPRSFERPSDETPRRLRIGRWLLGSSAALATASLVALVSDDRPVRRVASVSGFSAAAAFTAGLVVFVLAKRAERSVTAEVGVARLSLRLRF